MSTSDSRKSLPCILTSSPKAPKGGSGIKLPGVPKGPVPYVVGVGAFLTMVLAGYQSLAYSPPDSPDFEVDRLVDPYARDLAKTKTQGTIAELIYYRLAALPTYLTVKGAIDECKTSPPPAEETAFLHNAACVDAALASYQAGLNQVIADMGNPASVVYTPVGSAMGGVEGRLSLLDRQIAAARAGIAETGEAYRNGVDTLGRLTAERAGIQREQDERSDELTQATYDRMQVEQQLAALTAYNVGEDVPLSGVRRWAEDLWELPTAIGLKGQLSEKAAAEAQAQATLDSTNIRAKATDLEIKATESVLSNGENIVKAAYVDPTLTLLGDFMGYSGANDARDAQVVSVPEELDNIRQLSRDSILQDSQAFVEAALADARDDAARNKPNPLAGPIATAIGGTILTLTIAGATLLGRKSRG